MRRLERGICRGLTARDKSRTVATCVLGQGSSLSRLARISINTASSRRLNPGPEPARIDARDFCHGLLRVESRP